MMGRLVYHLLIHNAQTSLALDTSPLISYSELSLPLPESIDLWFSKSAEEWRTIYLESHPGLPAQLPSLLDCLSKTGVLWDQPSICDIELAYNIVAHAAS